MVNGWSESYVINLNNLERLIDKPKIQKAVVDVNKDNSFAALE
jgi:hypothetical protein